MTKRPTVVLAFSGGLDTSWCVPWLRETRNADVVTVTVDVGGLSAADRDRLAERSARLGARDHRVVDAREPFYREVLRFLIMGNVLRGHLYPLCVGSERLIQAREVARVARELGAGAVCHGCTAAGNDQVRFAVALRTLAPELEEIAPIRDLGLQRAEEVKYLEDRGLPVPSFGAAYSVNIGMWGVTIGGKETTGTRDPLPEDAWVWSKGAFEASPAPERHRIGFRAGEPVALDDEEAAPIEVIASLNRLGGRFGIGRGIHLGDTILGMKGRVAFEAPAAHLLIAAHRELEKLVLTGRQQSVKDSLSGTYGAMVHEGQHLDPAARDIEALFLESQKRVTGEVHLLLRPGSWFVEGVTSRYSLRDASRSVYGEATGEWTPEDARGFARLLALPSMLHARAGRDRGGDAS